MAFIKFGFLLICTLLVTQVTPSPMSNDVADDDMAKTIKKIIVDVTGFLDKVIDALYKATSILGKDGLPNFQKKTVEVALKILGKLKEIIDKELDRIQPQINNDAKKVSKCLETDGQEIINLLVSYYNVTSICFNPALKPLLISLQPLLVDLKKEDESVAALAPLLDQCKNEICVFGVLSKVVKQLADIPNILKKDIPDIKKTGKAFLDAAVACGKKEVDPWEKESYKLFNKIATCMRS